METINDIATNLAQSAVTLASLTIGGSFSGTIASDATTQTASPLAIGIATGGLVTINCTSQRIWLDVGSSQPTVVVVQTGSAPVADVVGGESPSSIAGTFRVAPELLPGLKATITRYARRRARKAKMRRMNRCPKLHKVRIEWPAITLESVGPVTETWS